MTPVRDLSYSVVPASNQLISHVTFHPLSLSRAPTPTLLGSNNQCGSALATEIDSYRRRIQTLLHFFDCIAQHWWDHLYPYKRDLIKRPSRSADEIRSYRTRLVARLNKFTMRTVAPAAAAIAMMEAQASVKVLPPNLLSPLSMDMMTMDVPITGDNGAALLNKACNLARRIGDIEKLKQRLILAALTWITSDGRDFNLRTQRIALLARHAEPCLIEHFPGVRALLTHYYRPRVLVQKSTGSGAVYATAKTNTTPRTEPITAARLTTTNEQIAAAIQQGCPRIRSTNQLRTIDSEDRSEELRSPLGNITRHSVLEHLSHTDDLFGSLSNSMHFPHDILTLTESSPIPMLPSIVLNPLSIDTSQLDWLSYEINQRDFNLHILNKEEPEDESNRFTRSPVSTPINRVKPVEDSVHSSVTSITKSNRSRVSGPEIMISTREIMNLSPSATRYRTTVGTPIAVGNWKIHGWSGSSHDSEFSGLDISLTSFVEQKPEETHRAEDTTTIGGALASLRSSDELSDSGRTQTPLTAHGEGAVTPSLASKHEHIETSIKESPPGTKGPQLAARNLTGKGEEPLNQIPTERKSTVHPTNQLMNAKKLRANVHWRVSSKQCTTVNQMRVINSKISTTNTPLTAKDTKFPNANNPLVPPPVVNGSHRNQMPSRTQLPNMRDRKYSR
ncbi:unnamed protein product [Echinostoma caproni]|uniref:DUF5738 domain-containing protein n=1 Tax=Echinostoma caproni TaxID=27848 RepID=A0A183B460_9TREM|nr:unnamed protein product [Echinostoma caproni]